MVQKHFLVTSSPQKRWLKMVLHFEWLLSRFLTSVLWARGNSGHGTRERTHVKSAQPGDDFFPEMGAKVEVVRESHVGL